MSHAPAASRIQRLFFLIREVKSRPGVTPGSLQKALGVSKATFKRDRDVLANLGFVFRYDRRTNRMIIDKDCFSGLDTIEPGELLAILLAVQEQAAHGDYPLSCEALSGAKKILTHAPGEQVPLFARLLEGIEPKAVSSCSDTIETLRQAILEQRRVRIAYHKPSSARAERFDVDPFQLHTKLGVLYLDGFSLKSKAIRTFRVSRIRSAVPTSLGFSNTRGYSYAQRYNNAFNVFTGDGDDEVVLHFSPEARPYIEEMRWHHTQRISVLPDGGISFSVRVHQPEEVLWWALRWGLHMRVVRPVWLKDVLKGMLQGMLAQLDDGA